MISVLTVTPGRNHDSLLNLLWLHKGPFYFFTTLVDEILNPGLWQPYSCPAPTGEVLMGTSSKGQSIVMIEALDKSCLGPQRGFQHCLAIFLWSIDSS